MAKAKSLDFTKVKDGGGQFNKLHQQPGDYRGRVTKVIDTKSKEKKPMWLFTIKVGGGEYPYYCTFEENTVWKIRNLFVAAGISTPKKKINVDPNLAVGKEIALTLEDDEYEGKLRSSINAVFPVSELEEGEGDVPEEVDTGSKKKKGKKSKAAPEPEPAGKKGKKKGKKMESLDIDDM